MQVEVTQVSLSFFSIFGIVGAVLFALFLYKVLPDILKGLFEGIGVMFDGMCEFLTEIPSSAWLSILGLITFIFIVIVIDKSADFYQQPTSQTKTYQSYPTDNYRTVYAPRQEPLKKEEIVIEKKEEPKPYYEEEFKMYDDEQGMVIIAEERNEEQRIEVVDEVKNDEIIIEEVKRKKANLRAIGAFAKQLKKVNREYIRKVKHDDDKIFYRHAMAMYEQFEGKEIMKYRPSCGVRVK